MGFLCVCDETHEDTLESFERVECVAGDGAAVCAGAAAGVCPERL